MTGPVIDRAHAGCDIYEMGSGKFGFSVGEVTAVFDPANSILRYTCADPQALIVTGSGRALALPAPQKDFTITLSRGTSCLFYPPGAKLALNAVEHLVNQAALSAANAGATLALHHIERPERNTERLEFSTHPICATLAREATRTFAERHGLHGNAYELSVAVGEAVANAIEYSEGGEGSTFVVDCVADTDAIYIHVENPGHWRIGEQADERGRGIPIMAAFSRSLEITSSDERTRVSLGF